MPEVTTTGSYYIGSQELDVRHHLVYGFLGQLFPDGLKNDFQLNYFRIRLEFEILFRHGAPDVIVQCVQICKVWGHSYFSMNQGQFT